MKKDVKEPIKVKWIWPVILVISLATIPWLFPTGNINPVIGGFPLWIIISLVATIALAIFLNYVVSNFWDMEALVEDKVDKTDKTDNSEQ